MIAKVRQSREGLSHLPRGLILAWDAARGWTTVWFALLVVQGLLPVATVLLTRLVVDGLITSRNTGASLDGLRPVLVGLAALAGMLVLGEVLRSVAEWVRTAQSELVQDYITGLIHRKATAVDLAFYESAEYYDHLHRARDEANTRSLSLLENTGSLLQNGITFVAMAAVLLPYGAWLPLPLVASTIPAFYVAFRFNRRYHRWWEDTTPDRRWAQYYDLVLTNSGFAAELRLFDLGAHFREAYQRLRGRLRGERMGLTRDQSLARLAAGGAGFLILGLALTWMAVRALQGWATLGDLALFYQAFNQGQSLLRSLLSNVGQIYSNSLFLGNLFEFLGLEPAIVDPMRAASPATTPCPSVRFRRVTFRYPGSDRAVLRDFDLTIPAAQIVAIVGANGAGKSTLIKLLCRFYDPDAGRVELDGIDVRQILISEPRRQITVLFQFPAFYHATAADNIAVGDLAAAPTPEEIETAARAGGAHDAIARLPMGYDTLLGKWFSEGTELSGGEWQRIGLSRAFLRQAPVVVLDEPTSFMDSWAEIQWLARFRELVRGRTTLIITHRFTTAMHANVIHVMDDGQIIESGTHDQLIARGGRYAESWSSQLSQPHRVVVA